MKKLLALFMTVLCIFVFAGCTADGTPPEAELQMTAQEMSAAYENDKDNADKTITGKIVEVTGTVSNVTAKRITLDREDTYGFIMCNMSGMSQDFGYVQKGDIVTIRGQVEKEFGNINMANCYFIKTSDVENSNQEQEQDEFQIIIEKIKTEREYWNQAVLTDLPALAAEEDQEGMVLKLEEITARLDEDITYFMGASQTEGISEELAQACLDMKTGFYGANSQGLKPMLDIFSGESTEQVDLYEEIISSADGYIEAAYGAVK